MLPCIYIKYMLILFLIIRSNLLEFGVGSMVHNQHKFLLHIYIWQVVGLKFSPTLLVEKDME
jgi:hypothetical protein